MHVVYETPDRLLIKLSRQDMLELNITFEQIDYRDPHTRQVMKELLHIVGAEDFFRGRHNRTLIEVFPADDGCEICFTALESSAERPKTITRPRLTPVVYEMDTADRLLDAAAALAAAGVRPIVCEAYEWGGRYRVVAVCRPTDRVTEAVLDEYGALIGSGGLFSSITAEHGRLLTSDMVAEMGGA